MGEEFALNRFVDAQDRDDTYGQALAELRRGHKATHWMWFVFPQIAGLGQSPTSRHFAIASLAEARAYLDHPVLGPRLRECAQVIAETTGRSSVDILGGVDSQKLRSSMTLFHVAAPDEKVFSQVLERHFNGRADPLTERLVAGSE